MWICPPAVEELNKAALGKVLVPEVITIDEKLRGFSGESPYLRFVPNKDPKYGHWITEASIKGKYTGMPYLINAFPVQQKSGPTMLGFYEHALQGISVDDKKNTVVVSDAYYMDDACRRYLRSNKGMYLAAINPTRFSEVWETLLLKVKHIGQWAVAWNAKEKEAALHYWHPEHGRIYLLTNAFAYQKNATPIKEPPFFEVYKHLFNSCDRLNHYLFDKGYPYRREGWQYDFDDFHFTSTLWNAYVLYHEYYALPSNLSWKTFCTDLAKELSIH